MRSARRTRRVALVDDHPWTLEGMRSTVSQLSGYEVAFTASGGREFMRQMKHTADVDLALIDMSMPDMDGDHVMRWLRAEYPHVRGIMVSIWDEPEWIRRGMNAGGSAFMRKAQQASDLLYVMDSVMEKGFYHSEIVRAAMACADQAAQALSRLGLTAQQMEFLSWVIHPADYTYEQIGGFMHVGKDAVDGYFRFFSKKYDLHSRTALVIWVYNNGLFGPIPSGFHGPPPSTSPSPPPPAP